jgi:RNA polymerase sigma factor (sigma-70 family)
MMERDCNLLQEFIDHDADDAFRTLVERHAPMVHGVALRILRDEGVAQEVTQAVFILLARKARQLPRETVIAGWLHRSARFIALEAARTEKRRQRQQAAFVEMNAFSTPDSLWYRVEPLLDEALNRLGTVDRDAVVLRFLEGRSFAEVAAALSTTEAAAKMRVGRALEKLRCAFARRGVVAPAAVLLASLSTHATSAAPAGLSAAVAVTALANQATIGSTLPGLVQGGLKAMAWAKIKSALIMSTIVVTVTGSAIFLQRQLTPKATSTLSVASLDPMAGEWEGTFERRGGGAPDSTQPVSLSIRTSRAGHLCEIEMRVSNAAGQPVTTYHFTHTLNRSGNGINTVDDPQVARMFGDGVIIESATDSKANEWCMAFRTPGASRDSYSECRVVRKGDELNTTRSDWIGSPRGRIQLVTELKLRRRAGGQAQL